MNKLWLIIVLALSATTASAFNINGTKWPGAETDFYVGIPGTSPAGITWDIAFIAAIEDWNSETVFTFNVIEERRDPCAPDRVNGVDFTDDVCGSAYGSGTLAVALRSLEGAILGPPNISEADIVFNNSVDFDVFDGNLRQFGRDPNLIDFRRVALHELGHVLGLDHEETNAALMAPSISNLDRLQEDDIAGANALYSGLSNCPIIPLVFGSSTNSLAQGDCTADALTVGSGDPSFLDLYGVTLNDTATITARMSSGTLDSALIIADTRLNFIAADNNAVNACDSTLTQTLPAGNYIIIANTFNVDIKPECTTFGAYELTVDINSSAEIPLIGNASLNGGISNASFSGGIRANGQSEFGNRFRSTDSLDIQATINIDPIHQGQPGFLVVAGILGSQLFLLDAQGLFIDVSDRPGEIIRAQSKTLAAIEPIAIANDLVPAALGITQANVNFLVGYGLESNPTEVFFHRTPINLTIEP